MGLVFEEITLKNAVDVVNSKHGIIDEQDIHYKTVQALVDTGAKTLVINDKIRQELGLGISGEREGRLANDKVELYKITEPVEVIWKNRSTTVNAIVASENGKVLLGAIPLEDMDLIVDPTRLKLIGAHGDTIETILMPIN